MDEFYSMQNYALGASALLGFSKSYYDAKEKKEGPILPYLMPVLPIVFNEKCVSTISSIDRTTKSRFLTTLSENRDLPVGLQLRMIDMAEQTLKSLNIAFSTSLLGYNKENTQVIPLRSSGKVLEYQYRDNQNIIKTSKILGKWFAQYSLEELCIALNINF